MSSPGPTTTTTSDPMVASTTSRPSAAPAMEQRLDHLQVARVQSAGMSWHLHRGEDTTSTIPVKVERHGGRPGSPFWYLGLGLALSHQSSIVKLPGTRWNVGRRKSPRAKPARGAPGHSRHGPRAAQFQNSNAGKKKSQNPHP